MKKEIVFFLSLVFMFLPLASAAHYIVGFVEDAKDGTLANGHEVVLWNPINGIADNLTDVVGPGGNSGNDNLYLIDCELLSTPCAIGDTLNLQITNNGDDYISDIQSVVVSGAGFDLVNNLSLNSPPNVSAIYPLQNSFLSNSNINLNCSASDLDSNLFEVSLYGNWSGGWHLNETQSISGTNNYFESSKTLSEGTYSYGCSVEDNLSITRYSENKTFVVDLTDPLISSVDVNASNFCGINQQVKIDCNVSDSLSGVSSVWIQAISPSSEDNFTSNYLIGENYYSEILLDETGSWNFVCWVNDSAGNSNSLGASNVEVYSSSPELLINSSKIIFNNSNPIEKDILGIGVEVENKGCLSSGEILVGLYDSDPDLGGVSVQNKTLNVGNLSYEFLNFSWEIKVGQTNLFVFVDSNNSLIENNESNNKGNKTISIGAWQEIYGNVSLDKILGYSGSRVSSWGNWSIVSGNIFIADRESSVDWLSLQAIGRDVSNGASTKDFLEIDQSLGMQNFNDSVSNIFSNSQIPKNTTSLEIHGYTIIDVPIIQSTESSDFDTGILWDTSDDSNNEYDSSEKEDIVFVTPLKKGSLGKYGSYDYEIKVPAKIREYYNSDVEEFYLYYDLE